MKPELEKYYAVMPTDLTDDLRQEFLDAWNEFAGLRCANKILDSHEQLERDVMTLALRLYAESDDTFAPETIECIERWRPAVKKMLDRYLADDEREGII